MNSIIQKSGCADQTWIKLCAKMFAIIWITNYALKNLQKFSNVSFIRKNNPDFFQNLRIISLAKKTLKKKMVKYSRCEIWFGFKADFT